METAAFPMVELLPGLVAQILFAGTMGYVSYAYCGIHFGRARIRLRWCATLVLCAWLHSLWFAILMTLRAFAILPALAAAAVTLALTWHRIPAPAVMATRLVGDLNAWASTCFPIRPRLVPAFTFGLFLLAATLLVIRALMLPLLAWDSLTYHGFKAGMWVQQGTWDSFNAPGGWEYYRTFFGGGEVFTAWAMLFPHSGVFAGLPDVAFWLFLGLVTACLAERFGLSRHTAANVAMAFLGSLAVSRFVGSGYIDTTATALLLAGVLFLVRVLHQHRPVDLVFAAGALGLAAAAKVNMLALCVLLSILVVWKPIRRVFFTRAGLFAALAFLAPVLPWLAHNYAQTGFPLGCTPLRLGPLRLGEAPPNLVWFMERSDLTPYAWRAEYRSLVNALQPFGASLGLPLLGVLGLLVGICRRQRAHLLVALPIAGVLALYFAPSFSFMRLGSAGVGGRFLLPALILVAVAGLRHVRALAVGSALVDFIALLAVSGGLLAYLGEFVLRARAARVEATFLLIASVLTALALLLLPRLRAPVRPWSPARMFTTIVSLLIAALLVGAAANSRWYPHVYARSTILHDYPRYWVPGLAALRAEPAPARIAVTYGPTKESHGAFLYPFLGRHFQNHLLYRSPFPGHSLVPHRPRNLRHRDPHFPSWLASLRSAKASHVLSLQPPGPELAWMQDNPDLFSLLAGTRDSWGLFRLNAPPPSPHDSACRQ